MSKGLALIFGPPKKEPGKSSDDKGENYNSDITDDFRDHCDAAYEAIVDKDSAKFCEEMWLAFKAYEEAPHEENDEDEDEDENGEEELEVE